jgi:hypothetical protein
MKKMRTNKNGKEKKVYPNREGLKRSGIGRYILPIAGARQERIKFTIGIEAVSEPNLQLRHVV